MNSAILTPASSVLGASHWVDLGPISRGLHVQLCLLAAQNSPIGTIANKPDVWKRKLQISAIFDDHVAIKAPEQKSFDFKDLSRDLCNETDKVTASLYRSLLPHSEEKENYAGMSESEIADRLWHTKWLVEIMKLWAPITDDLRSQWPHLSGVRYGENILFSPLSAIMAGLGPDLRSAPRRNEATLSKQDHSKNQLSASKNSGRTRNEVDKATTPDMTALHDKSAVSNAFNALPIGSRKVNMWDLAISMLSSQSTNMPANRAFVGKLIKEYGEAEVMSALTAISLRQQYPADIKSYVVGVLKKSKETGGMDEEALAIEQRTKMFL